jgi:class 3 adenylate cyclase
MQARALCAHACSSFALPPAVFGDTVNMASRMESTGAPGRVQVSEATALLLADVPDVRLQARGGLHVKGKGEVQTFWLRDANNAEEEAADGGELGAGAAV